MPTKIAPDKPIDINNEFKKEDIATAPLKSSWFKNVFNRIGKFFGKMFNTIASFFVPHTRIVHTETEVDFSALNNTETENHNDTQTDPVVEENNSKTDVIDLEEACDVDVEKHQLHTQKQPETAQEQTATTPEEETFETTQEKVDTESQEDVEIVQKEQNDVVSETVTVVPHSDAVYSDTQIFNITTDKVTEDEVPDNEEQPASFFATRCDTFNQLLQEILNISGCEITIATTNAESQNTVTVLYDDKQITFALDDAQDFAMGKEAVAEQVSENLSLPIETAKNLVSLLMENENIIKKEYNEKRTEMITQTVSDLTLHSREDMIQMALTCLDTPNRNRTKIEEDKDDVYFIITMDATSDDPDKIIMSNEIKVNLKDLSVYQQIESVNIMTRKEEKEIELLSPDKIPQSVSLICLSLSKNKEFLNKEFSIVSAQNKHKHRHAPKDTIADTVLNDNYGDYEKHRPKERNQKISNETARRREKQARVAQDEACYVQKTEEEHSSSPKTKYIPHCENYEHDSF